MKEKERSLIANLASAEKYSIEHFKTVQPAVEAAEIFYMAVRVTCTHIYDLGESRTDAAA